MSEEFKEDFLAHYGTPRHSGRYPWGSGKNPQRSSGFLQRVDYYRANGVSDTDIAKQEGMSTTEFRKRLSIAKNEERRADFAMAQRLKDKGMSNVAIGKRMGRNESYVRTLLKTGVEEKLNRLQVTTDILKDSVDDNKYIDVGVGVNRHMNVSDTVLKNAVKQLVDSGEYETVEINVPQTSNPHQYTNVKVLVKAGTPKSEIYDNMEKVRMPVEYVRDDGDGDKRVKINPPVNIDGHRVMVRYAEEGGTEKDGVMELRPGVKDLNLGNSRYAQVRIGLQGFQDEYHPELDNNKYYLKGMAVYGTEKDFANVPEGVDIIFNSNRKHERLVKDIFKEQKSDPSNPFGAEITRQNYYKDDKGKDVQGAVNIVSEEGKWGDWKKSLASQMLSKQPVELAKKQLNLAKAESDEEFETIMSLTNPVLKKQMLLQFADGCDADAVELKAAALPRQASHVILPLPSIKPTEIYAPNYEDGEEVVLIRYPHGGRFEIPRLKVNNKNKEGIEVLGKNPVDAVGINAKTAEQLSGADFDGDTVLVIPTRGVKIRNQAPLEELKDFDAKAVYGHYNEEVWKQAEKSGEAPPYRLMTKKMKGKEMGSVTNLITDMTLLGADDHEIARAVRHSMVVIDAEKHKLDFDQSYIDNGIAQLKEKYQGGARKGAATLISRSTSEERVVNRERSKKNGGIDPETGEIVWEEKPRYYEKTLYKGTPRETTRMEVEKPIKSTKMYERKDAYELSSGHDMENVYADYANHMKALGNKARKASLDVENPTWNRGATTLAYKDAIQSLDKKLDTALKNAPLERQAQMIARQKVKTKLEANPEYKDDADQMKKIRNIALREGREISGAGKQQIVLSDREWEAIQAGAVSKTKQEQIFRNCDQDKLKERAMPHRDSGLTPATMNRIRAMLDSGWTTKELADKFDVSTSTISAIKKGGE